MYYLLVMLTLLILILGYIVARYVQEGKKLPLNNSRIADKFLAGLAGGTVIAVIPALLFYRYYPINMANDGEQLRLFGIAIMYLPVGYAIGSAIGVYLVGNKSNETGSFLASLCGSLLVGLGVLGAILLFGGLGFILVVFIPVVLFGEPIVAIGLWSKTIKRHA